MVLSYQGGLVKSRRARDADQGRRMKKEFRDKRREEKRVYHQLKRGLRRRRSRALGTIRFFRRLLGI